MFDADFPNDPTWSPTGDISVPGGRMLLSAVAGWELEVASAGKTISVLLQYPGPWLLISERRPTLADRLRPTLTAGAHRTVHEALLAILREDARISQIETHTRASYERGPR